MRYRVRQDHAGALLRYSCPERFGHPQVQFGAVSKSGRPVASRISRIGPFNSCRVDQRASRISRVSGGDSRWRRRRIGCLRRQDVRGPVQTRRRPR